MERMDWERDVERPGYELLIGPPYEVRFDESPRNFVHRHTFYEPCLVMAGSGEFVHGDDCHRIRPGDLFMPEPGRWHEVSSVATRDLVVRFTQFAIVPAAGPAPGDLLEQSIISDFLRAHDAVRRGCAGLGHAFDLVSSGSGDERGIARRKLDEAAMRLAVLRMLLELTTSGGSGPLHRSDVVDQAVESIRAAGAGGVRISEVASLAGVSERHLRRLFRLRLGHSVADEIWIQRIRAACALLRAPELSVTQVAARVGIGDPARFSRVFRRVVGVSPSEFRRGGGAGAGSAPMDGAPMRTDFFDEV